jgi:hypothetical protein
VALRAETALAQTTPISISNSNYFQNFDAMGTTTATSTYPSGWNGYKITGNPSGATSGTFINSGSTPPLIGDDGSANTGTVRNYGTIGSTERALGSTADSNTAVGFGVVLLNDTGRVLTASDITIAFRAEQWST